MNPAPSTKNTRLFNFIKRPLIAIFFTALLPVLLISCEGISIMRNDSNSLSDTIKVRAHRLRDSGLFLPAIRYTDSAYRHFQNPSHSDLYKKYNFLFNTNLYYTLNIDAAILYADSMRKSAEAEPEGKVKADDLIMAYLQSGDVLLKAGRYREGYRYFVKGKLEAEKREDKHLMDEYYHRLAMANYWQGEYARSNKYFKEEIKALTTQRHRDTFDRFCRLQEAYDNVGITYQAQDKKDSAYIFFKFTLAFLDKCEPDFPDKKGFFGVARSVVYGNLSETYREMDSLNQATFTLKESLRLIGSDGPKTVSDYVNIIGLAELCARECKFNTADSLLNSCKDAIYSLKHNQAKGEWLNVKWMILDLKKDTGHAYTTLTELNRVDENRRKYRSHMSSQDITREIENLEREQELEVLKREDIRKNYLLGITCIASAMALFIIWLIRKNLNQSKSNEKRLGDMNEQIQSRNDYLQVALHSLEQSQADNTRLMKIVAHDLRSPIGGVKSAAEILLDEPGRSEDDIEMLQVIKDSAANSLALITGLLQPQATNEDLHKTEIRLDSVLHYCIDILRFKAAEKDQQLNMALLPITITADREKLWRVFTNLITNAIKFSPRGAELQVKMIVDPDKVSVLVTDNGIGIPDNMLERIFEGFEDARRTGTSGEETYGLGLAICKQIVSAHGGKIWVKSEVGKGTTFHVDLPL